MFSWTEHGVQYADSLVSSCPLVGVPGYSKASWTPTMRYSSPSLACPPHMATRWAEPKLGVLQRLGLNRQVSHRSVSVQGHEANLAYHERSLHTVSKVEKKTMKRLNADAYYLP